MVQKNIYILHIYIYIFDSCMFCFSRYSRLLVVMIDFFFSIQLFELLFSFILANLPHYHHFPFFPHTNTTSVSYI
ncbi:hypothetical protein C1645_790153 [Glomus cerebriforme]|uniref:Uncharacterized protein n=1 Tax=Glomus cerebriforme TaxID=658196 RepID=A0A397S9Z9_9GLOM|nr:hypothetical protein C1645_790153 [Glomus cerebriforme]